MTARRSEGGSRFLYDSFDAAAARIEANDVAEICTPSASVMCPMMLAAPPMVQPAPTVVLPAMPAHAAMATLRPRCTL